MENTPINPGKKTARAANNAANPASANQASQANQPQNPPRSSAKGSQGRPDAHSASPEAARGARMIAELQVTDAQRREQTLKIINEAIQKPNLNSRVYDSLVFAARNQKNQDKTIDDTFDRNDFDAYYDDDSDGVEISPEHKNLLVRAFAELNGERSI